MSALIALTDNAVEAVKQVVSSTDASLDGGLRIVAEQGPTQTTFEVTVVELPAEDDVVIEEDGARLFLDQDAAALLDDKVLDAGVDRGQLAFTIADQGA